MGQGGGGRYGGRGRAEWLVDLSLIERDRGWQLQQESRLRVPREVAIPFWLLPRLRAGCQGLSSLAVNRLLPGFVLVDSLSLCRRRRRRSLLSHNNRSLHLITSPAQSNCSDSSSCDIPPSQTPNLSTSKVFPVSSSQTTHINPN